jgi:salicylate hydroxylase
VQNPDELDAAFRVYDRIRRPRAQRVAQTSYEAGVMYSWNDPNFGDDMQKIVDNANERLHWIWQHDLKGDADNAEAEFLQMTRGSEKSSTVVTVNGSGMKHKL